MNSREIYISDLPLEDDSRDWFQRSAFANRIADTIVSRNDSDSIVVGIYGKWGEGKTTVLNFISKKIKTIDPEIIQIKFNPWRFSDEITLLNSFFNMLAVECKKADNQAKRNIVIRGLKKTVGFLIWLFKRNHPLKSNFEVISELFGKYSESLPRIGKVTSEMGKRFADVDIETLKNRLEERLKEYKKKIVIIIDDMDRLDKNELHAIFRLVKLTCNFPYSTYILSFDHEIVASAIGDRFGEGSKESGLQFLEKIIQIPLALPQASASRLKEYCFDLINNGLESIDVNLTDDEADRFGFYFNRIVLKLNSPRMAIRYSNSLVFALKLLQDEVNMADLMLMEAVKVFFPEYYDLVRKNPSYFIEAYGNPYLGATINTEKIEQINSLLNRASNDQLETEKKAVISLLQDLFPHFRTHQTKTHIQEFQGDWYKEKRICSPDYFEKYFTYAVIHGDISDVRFKSFIDSISLINKDEFNSELQLILKEVKPDSLIAKLNNHDLNFNQDDIEKISITIAENGHLFPEDRRSSIFSTQSPQTQIILFLLKLLGSDVTVDKNDLASKIIIKADTFSFALSFYNRFTNKDYNELIDDENKKHLARVFINCSLKYSGDKTIFEFFPDYPRRLAQIWSIDLSRDEFMTYIKTYFDKDSNNVIRFLDYMTPIVSSSARKSPYKSDLNQEAFVFIDQVADIDYLYQKLCSVVSPDVVEAGKKDIAYSDGHFDPFEQTTENIIKQFIYWYNLKKNSSQDQS